MNALLLERGRLLDPARALDLEEGSLLLVDGLVAFAGPAAEADARARALARPPERFDARGRWIVPGLVDMHVHLREPGNEAEETIASGVAAAVAGGFTSVVCMPNTSPALDDESSMIFVRREAARAGLANVFPVGAVSSGREGKELAEMAQMKRGGAVAFSDDGTAVPAAGLLRQALSYARMLGLPILEHCEDPSLAGSGQMNEGPTATALGLPGIPAEAEEIIIARDILLARLTGARVHLQHVSTGGGANLLRMAKQAGVPVTAEVTPHHLTLTDECVRGYDPVFKVNPPLRAKADNLALLEALRDGTLDAIATDHAPHQPEEKEGEFATAPCGMLGLETAVGVLLTELYHPGGLSAPRLIEALTAAPSGILNLGRGTLAEGVPGDATVIDPERVWTVDAGHFRSKSRNCPYRGRTLRGRAVLTVVNGRVVYRCDNP